MWEFYLDEEEGLWAVRQMNYNDYDEHVVFHVHTMDEAIALSATLNGYELTKGVH